MNTNDEIIFHNEEHTASAACRPDLSVRLQTTMQRFCRNKVALDDYCNWDDLCQAQAAGTPIYHFEAIKYAPYDVSLTSITLLGLAHGSDKLRLLPVSALDNAIAKPFVQHAAAHLLLNNSDVFEKYVSIASPHPLNVAMVNKMDALLSIYNSCHDDEVGIETLADVVNMLTFSRQYHSSLPDVRYLPEQQDLFSSVDATADDSANWPVLNDNRLLKQLDYLASVAVVAPCTDEDDDD